MANIKNKSQITEAKTIIEEPVADISTDAEVVVEDTLSDDISTSDTVTVASTTNFEVGTTYTYIHAVNVRTEPSMDAITIGVRSVNETITPERIHEADGYIWAEFHTSKHIRFAALSTSDGSEKFVK
jgi:predicted ABC-type ATPase